MDVLFIVVPMCWLNAGATVEGPSQYGPSLPIAGSVAMGIYVSYEASNYTLCTVLCLLIQ